jgi:hypothetical protein
MADDRIDETMEVARMAADLFRKVETHQGYFHVSDGEMFASKAKFFERIRGRLNHGRRAVHKMEAFLRKHGQLRDLQ